MCCSVNKNSWRVFQLISHEHISCVEQNEKAEQVEVDSSPFEEGSLPDLTEFSDLGSIVTLGEEEDLIFDIVQVCLT